MSEVGDYLMKNYYAKYDGDRTDIIPSVEQLEFGLMMHPQNIVVVRDKDKIMGVGIFVKLTDETYENIDLLDITDIDVLTELLKEDGDNIHFVLLCATGYFTILEGIKVVREKHHPKTISWWSRDLTYLHRMTLN